MSNLDSQNLYTKVKFPSAHDKSMMCQFEDMLYASKKKKPKKKCCKKYMKGKQCKRCPLRFM